MVKTDPTKVCRIQHLTTNSQSQGHNFGSNLVRNLMYWHNSQPPSPKFKVTPSTQMSVHRSYVLRVLSVHARIQEFFVRGGPGQSDKKALTTFFFFFFFSPQLVLQSSNGQFQRNLSFFKVQEGVQHFPGEGGPTFSRGVQLLIPYRNPYNL